MLRAVVAMLAHIAAAMIGQLAALWHWFGFPPMLLREFSRQEASAPGAWWEGRKNQN